VIDAYLRRVPKVELHVHLEGGIAAERLLSIRRRHALQPQFDRAEELAWVYRHADFAEFLDHFRFAVTSLRDVEDVHAVAGDLCAALAAQNVVYAEVIFSAGIFVRMGMPWDELLAAADTAASAAESLLEPAPGGPPARYNLVIDLVRNFGPEFALQQVESLARAAHPRVVGVHLGGDEIGFPARLFAAAYGAARSAGLGCAAHAGEAAGPESVRDALRLLGVTRIGHGVRSLEDPDLVAELLECGTTLEVCPTSNVCTGIVPDLAAHPLPALLARGVPVTLGADDPSFFDTDTTREMQAANRELGLDLATLDALTENGLRAAFLPEPERQARLAGVRAARSTLRRELGLPAPRG
jgi:adenosine deaminase